MMSFQTLTKAFMFVVLPNICAAQTLCKTDGWFGPNCQYQCHCANSAPCDKVDGSCSSGCHSDWFGPACQYDRATFTASGLGWLTDNSETTCNTGSSQSVTVDLNTAIPLSWIRVVLNDAGKLNQIELSYWVTTASTFQSCTDLKTAKVDTLTLDIYCPTNTTVNRITLSGPGVTRLCALYISGGRNVALKQPTEQSTRYDPPTIPGNNFFLAQYAVDGRVNDGSVDSYRFTCTHTDVDPSPDWWTVNFTQPADIIKFLIFNRNDASFNNVRLIGFTLTALPESSTTATPYTYTDRQTSAQASYLIVPSSKIGFPVSRVRVDVGPHSQILTLCEVYVFGEFHCPSGTFGLSCERQCNCASGGRTCFIHSGGCPDGCATNYDGLDCYDCVAGKYGTNCDLHCSVHCGGDNSCDRETAICSHECDPGYTGDRCQSECPRRKYGPNCTNTCSDHCARSDNGCHFLTGICNQGCEPGYQPPLCFEACPRGRYGQDCSHTCSDHCAGPVKDCDFETGLCYQGCEVGFQPPTCQNECPAGRYGQDCERTCSVHCAGSACNKTDGSCDFGCEPGYFGRFCSEICPRGRYGSGCVQNCSVRCAGQNNPCHHVDGGCYFGCVEDDQSPICHGLGALHQSGKTEGSPSYIWAITTTIAVVFAASTVVIAVLYWRQRKAFKESSATLQASRIVEAGSQLKKNDQRPALPANRPSPPSQPTETGPEYVHIDDLYDRPEDLARKSGEYENPRPLALNLLDKDYVEPGNVNEPGYVNSGR